MCGLVTDDSVLDRPDTGKGQSQSRGETARAISNSELPGGAGGESQADRPCDGCIRRAAAAAAPVAAAAIQRLERAAAGPLWRVHRAGDAAG